MLAFHRRWDLDLVTMMPSAVSCVEDWGCEVEYLGAISGAKQCRRHAVQTPGDWDGIGARDVGAGALGRELEAVTATMVRYAEASFAAGADGILLATQVATAEALTREEHARFEAPRVRRILEAVAGRSRLTMLHVHGDDPYLDVLATMPAHALNWHDRSTPVSLGAAMSRFTLALAGGLDQDRTLRKESPAAVAAETRDAIAQTGGVGLIVAPGCVLPLDVPDASLAAVIETVK
jgi:uroporphyrinogen decarboxylase